MLRHARFSQARVEASSRFVAEVRVLQRRQEMRAAAAALLTSPPSPGRMEAEGLHADAAAAHFRRQIARTGLLHHVDFVRVFVA